MKELYKSLPLFVIVVVLIVSSFRRQLQDNQPWRRGGSVVLGVVFIIWGGWSMGTGHITAWRHNTHIYSATTDPVGFWLMVSFVIVLGAGCVYRGFRGRK